jgi:hypothetical protein
MLLTRLVFESAALLALSRSVICFAIRSDLGSVSFNRLYGRADEDDFNPEDLSYLKRIAAVGDSYSAGIGAGRRLGGLDGKCCCHLS